MSVDDFAVFSKGTICSQFIDSVPMLEIARAASQVEMKLSVLLERRSEWEANFVVKYGIELGEVGLVKTHVPPVPSIEHWKRDQYCPVTGGNFRKSVPTCMRYASVCRLEVFENPWKDARKFWQPDRVPKRNQYR